MANIKWKTGTTGDWNVAGNWSPGSVPGSGDAVTISAAGNYDVIVDDAESAQSVQLNSAGATLIVEGGPGVVLSVGGNLNTVAGTLSVVADDTSTYGSITGGTVTTGASGTLFAQSFVQDPNFSSFEIDSAVSLAGKTIVASDTNLNLFGGGTLGGTFSGAGDLQLESHPFSSTTPTFTSTVAALSALGALDVSAATLIMTNGASGSFAGGVDASAKGSIVFLGNSTVTMQGALQVSYDANLLLGSGCKLTLPASVLLDNSGQIYIGANASVLSSGSLDVGLGEILDTEFDTTIYGSGTLTTTGSFTVTYPGQEDDQLFLGKGLTWSNSGYCALYSRVAMNVVSGDALTIMNLKSGTIDLGGDTADIIDHYTDGTDTLSNAGTLGRALNTNVSNPGTSSIAAIVNSTGVIDVEQGTLAFTDGGSISGTLNGAGTLLLYSGSYTLGAIAGSGNLAFGSGATITYTTGSTIKANTVLDGNSTLTVASGSTTTYGGNVTVGDSTGGVTIAGGGTLSTTGNTTFTNEGATPDMVTTGSSTYSNSGVITDSGVITFNGFSGDGGTIVNVKAATFNLAGDNASFGLSANTGGGNDLFSNLGTLAKTSGTGTNTIGVFFNTAGNVNVVSGAIAATAGGTIGGAIGGTGQLQLEGGTFTAAGAAGAGTLVIGGSGDLASFSSGTSAVNVAHVLLQPGGTLSAASGAFLSLSGSLTVGATTATYSAPGNFNGPGTIATSGTTTIADAGTSSELVVGNGATWSNTGVVNATGLVSFNAYSGDGGSIVNQAGGRFNLLGNDAAFAASANTGPGNDIFDNLGTLTGDGNTSNLTVALDTTGTVNVAAGGVIALQDGGTLGGTLTGAGTLEMLAGSFLIDQAGISGAGTLTLATGGLLTPFSNGTITTHLALAGGVVSGSGTLLAGGITTLADNGGTADVTLENGAILANSGTITDSGLLAFNGFSGDGATITNNSTGTFILSGADATLAASANTGSGSDVVNNAGLLTQASGNATIAVGLNNTGTINVSAGTVTASSGGTLGGTLTGAGQLALTAGVFTANSITGAGTLAVLNAADLAGATAGTSTIAVTNLHLDDDGVLSAASGTTLRVTGTLTAGSPPSSYTAQGYFSGPGTIVTAGTTQISDGVGNPLLDVDDNVTWSNTGTVNDAGYVAANAFSGDGATIVNQAGAIYNFTGDDGSIAALANTGPGNDVFQNLGLLSKVSGTGTNVIAIGFTTAGTVAVNAGGVIALSDGATIGGTLTGTGLLEATGGTVTIASGGVAGAGTLAIASNAILATSGTISSQLLFNGGMISGSGTVTSAGTTTVSDGGGGAEVQIVNAATWVNTGTVLDAGVVNFNGFSGDGATLTNAASGVFNLTTDDAAVGPAPNTGNGSDVFNNAGILAKTGGVGTSTIGVVLANTGTIAVNTGTIALAAAGAIGGTVNGAGVLSLGAAFTTGGIAGNGNILISGTSLTGTKTGKIAPSVKIDANGTLAIASGANLTLSGNLIVGDATGYGNLSGPGTLTTTGTTAIGDSGGALEALVNGTLTWNNSGTINDAGLVYFGYNSTGGASLTNTGTLNLAGSDASIILADSSFPEKISSSGLIAKTGGAGTSTISVATTSTGSIAVATGTLALTGGGGVSGALTGAGLLDLGGGAFITTGINGAGNLAISGAAKLTGTATGTITSTTLIDGNAALAAAKNVNLIQSGNLTIGDATGYGNLSGPGTITTTGTTAIGDSGGALQALLNGTLTWANSGTINDAGLVYFGYNSTGGASLTNTGTLNLTTNDATIIVADSSFPEKISSSGLIAKTGGTGISTISVATTSTGAIAVATGTLALTGGGGVSGALTGAGQLDLGGGLFTTTGISGAGNLAISGAAKLTATATGTITSTTLIDGNAALAVAKSSNLTLSGNLTIGDASGYGDLSGPGTITTIGTTAIGDSGGALQALLNGTLTWANSGTINDAGLVYFGYNSSGGATLSNTGTLNLTSNDAALVIADSSVPNVITNAGLLAKTGGTGTSAIGLAITNTGTIEAAVGTLTLQQAVTGAGSLKIDAGATLDIGTIPTSQKISFNGGTGATLRMDVPASIGTLTNFGAGDRLDLVGDTVTSAKITGTTLTVVGSSGTFTYVSVALANDVATFAGDNSNGSFVSIYRAAVPTHTPEPLAFGNFHVGSSTGTLQSLTVTNSAAADGYSEKLNASFGGASSGFAAMGSVNGILAGASNSTSLTATIDTSTAGAKSGTATLTLASNGAGIDGRGTTALPSQTVNFTGGVYAYAIGQLASSTINLGIIHTSTASGAALSLTNAAAANGYSESLDAGLTGASAGLTASGSISLLGAGQTDTSTLQLTVNSAASGAYSGTAKLGLISDGAGTSGLGTTVLSSQTVTVTATLDNYALAAFEDSNGPALIGTSTNETLNLGSTMQGGAALSVTIGALNAQTGLSDLLGGTLSTTGGTGFTNSGFGSFSGLAAGQDEHAQSVTLSTGTAGMFTETILLTSAGSNASGYTGALPTETLTITGTITPSVFATYTLALGPNIIRGANGPGDIFIASAGALNTRDQLFGGNGANSLSLTGAGLFDINAPSVLSNIPTINAVEGQAAMGANADTRQIVELRDGVTETLNVAAGTAAAGNSNAEAITIYAFAGIDTINLAGGADQVLLGTGNTTITLGGAANSVTGGGGTALIHSTAAFATAAVAGTSGAQTTLDITTGGNVTLNTADTYLTVKLDAASTLNLSAMSFITALGSSGNDKISAFAGTQTLTGGAGTDTLTGYTGGHDTFSDTAAGLGGDTIVNWTTGDTIDITNIVAANTHALKFNNNTLTVTDGTTSAAIKFAAGQAVGNFTVLGSDGAGGVLIGYHT